MPFKEADAIPATSYYIEDPWEPWEQQEFHGIEHTKTMNDNDYKPVDLKEYCREQAHLTEEQQEQLLTLLLKYEDLFEGGLGTWKGEQVELELKEGAQPYHAKPFPVPRIHYDKLKRECERLVNVGVLKKVNRSEWAAPTFCIAKKDGKIRSPLLTDVVGRIPCLLCSVLIISIKIYHYQVFLVFFNILIEIIPSSYYRTGLTNWSN